MEFQKIALAEMILKIGNGFADVHISLPISVL